jgi:hypothetical protein
MSTEESFRFSFASKYSVVQSGQYCAIEERDVWNDAQVPPPPEFDEVPYTTLISAEECSAIFTRVNAIDWSRYQKLSDSDFEVTPPGMQYSERLFVKIGDVVEVDWIKDFRKLKSGLRASLEAIEQSLSDIATKRRYDVVLPDSLRLSLMTEGEEPSRFELVRDNGINQLSDSTETSELSDSKFRTLWDDILDLRLLVAEFVPTEVAADDGSANRRDALSISINGEELVGFSFERPYENEGRVNDLRDLLASVAEI